MAIVGLITLVVCISGLIIWLALTGFARGTFTEMGKIMFWTGLLAFLIAVSGQSCSVGTSGVQSGVSAPAHR